MPRKPAEKNVVKDALAQQPTAGVTDKDRIEILLSDYKDQNDWQRHNENQRAQIANVLLVISAALLALFKDKQGQSIPVFLIIIGIFGFLTIMKYWERFLYHVQREDELRKALDSYFPDKLLSQTRNIAFEKHNKERLLLKDKYLKQHLLWAGIFVLIALLGAVLLVTIR